jgi:hypothetical protein
MKKILLFSFTAFILILSGCNTNNNSDPKTVLNQFFDALAKKDVTEAKKYVTKDSEGMMGMVEMGMKNMPDSSNQMMMTYKKENMQMGDPVIDGDRATIPVKDKKSGEETDFVLKKESGNWKVAFDKSTLMEMAQKKMKEHGINGMNGMDGMGMDSSKMDSMNMDSIQNKLNNLTPEEKAEANKMIDSAQNILEKMQKKIK